MKTHFANTRLYNNVGIGFPQCKANAPILDLDATRLKTSGDIQLVDCINCLKSVARTSWCLKTKKAAQDKLNGNK